MTTDRPLTVIDRYPLGVTGNPPVAVTPTPDDNFSSLMCPTCAGEDLVFVTLVTMESTVMTSRTPDGTIRLSAPHAPQAVEDAVEFHVACRSCGYEPLTIPDEVKLPTEIRGLT